MHHIRQRGAGFRPAASFQAAVRVNPQSLHRDTLRGFLQQRFDPLHARHVWRVNIIYSRPDFIGVLERFERLQQLHIGPRGFNGDHVSVQRGNGVHDVIELAIAHVSMDLRVVFGDRSIKAEGFHTPLQIGIPVAALQR